MVTIGWSGGLWLVTTTSCHRWSRTWRSRSSPTWSSRCSRGLFISACQLLISTLKVEQGQGQWYICGSARILSHCHSSSLQLSVLHYIRLNYPRLCRSAWVGIGMYRTFEAFCLSLCLSAYLSVCLFVCLFVRSITQKRMAQSVQTWYMEWPWDILEVVQFWDSKVKVTGSISSFFTLMCGELTQMRMIPKCSTLV